MADLIRVSILGLMPGGEEWSVNPVWSLNLQEGNVTLTQDELNTMAAAINAVVVPTGVRAAMIAANTITGVRLEARTVAGVLEAQAEAGRTPVAGTGTMPHPYQTSVVLSLRTAHPGPSGRGRMYWPATGFSMGAGTLRLDPTTLTAFVAGMKSYLALIDNAIATVEPNGTALMVWSRKNQALYDVNLLEAGDVADVQRRRRDQLVEARTSTLYP